MAEAEKSAEPSTEAAAEAKPVEANLAKPSSEEDESLEEGKQKSSSEKTDGEDSTGRKSSKEETPASDANKDGSGGQGRRKSSREKTDGEPPTRRNSKQAARRSSRKSFKGVAGGDDLDNDEEEKEEVPKTIYPIDEKIQRTLRTAWTLFVKKNQKKKTEISETDAPTVLRSIGINPTEAQIQTLIAYTKSQDLPTCSRGFMTYECFEQRVAETLHLQPELWIRKSKDEIMAAFEGKGVETSIDNEPARFPSCICYDLQTVCEYKGEIEAEKFKKLMMTKGDGMSDPEGNMMLRVAKDRDTSLVYLDEYADILSKDAIPQPPPDPTIW